MATCHEGLRVTEIVPGGAAFKSGRICVEDILISIDGHHVMMSFLPCPAAFTYLNPKHT